jgi:hypothetical protein
VKGRGCLVLTGCITQILDRVSFEKSSIDVPCYLSHTVVLVIYLYSDLMRNG